MYSVVSAYPLPPLRSLRFRRRCRGRPDLHRQAGRRAGGHHEYVRCHLSCRNHPGHDSPAVRRLALCVGENCPLLIKKVSVNSSVKITLEFTLESRSYFLKNGLKDDQSFFSPFPDVYTVNNVCKKIFYSPHPPATPVPPPQRGG